MSALVQTQATVYRPQLAAIGIVGSAMVAIGVFLSGFVISEPAPYELFMASLVGLWFLLGLKISRTVGALLGALLVFEVGGMLSLTTMLDLEGAPMYVAVSTFLALTAVFYAAIVEDDHRRLRLIFRAWVISALITSMLGILGYFHAFPGSEVFTLYDRAKGAFQDPNVFGPFLVAPSLYLVHGVLTGRLAASPLKLAALLVLALGVFLSFSRAAWALFLFCAVLLVLVLLLKERTGAFRLKIFILSLVAVVMLVLSVLIALQVPKVANLFTARAQLEQEYDAGHLGRFERHQLGFLMSMERPLGIGPMMFGKIYPEDEHNIWLKTLTTYGWLGFVTYVGMMIATLAVGFRYLLRDRPWQPYLAIAWITIAGHVAIGNVIDTDHWRHFYLLLGIVWGCIALEHRHLKQIASGRPA